MATITIPLSKKDKEHLSRLALRYGLSLSEFSKYVLAELTSDIPAESLSDYEHSGELKASLNRALADWRGGRVYGRL